MTTSNPTLDLAAIRQKLENEQGPRFWRSLEELANTKGFEEFLHREFPSHASEFTEGAGRRNFLKLMGASLALAGLGSCTRQPRELLIPYVRQPEEMVPGKPLFFATSMPLHGVASGLLVESHMGRPTKVEGNPEHPGSLGAADVFSQASVLGLYDPDRSQSVTYLGEIRSWANFLESLRPVVAAQRLDGGKGMRLLTETVTSPTLAAQIRGILKELPGAKWVQYEPSGPHSSRAGVQAAFGQAAGFRYDLTKAEVIVALESEFLTSGAGSVRYARDFAEKRRVRGNGGTMSRFYAAESTVTPTGGSADHRLPATSVEIDAIARSLAAAAGLPVTAGAVPAHAAKWVEAVKKDLLASKGKSLVIAGESATPAVHALAHAINTALGNAGQTIVYTDPLEAQPSDQIASLRELTGEMEAGKVSLLLIVGGNPVYNAPADLRFREAMGKVKLRVHLGLYDDETAELCHWHVAEAHYLETWGDHLAFDGTVSLQQPLIAPLYLGRSPLELLAQFTDRPDRAPYDAVRDYWDDRLKRADFDDFWRKSVHDGVISGTALPAKPLALKAGWQDALPKPASAQGLEVVFRTDTSVHDGRFTNNGWLQELPRPLSKLTWDNAALIAPSTAQKLDLQNGDLVDLRIQGRTLRAPVLIQPGQALDSLTLPLGYGRTRSGRVASGVGFNAYSVRTAGALWSAAGVELKKVGRNHKLAVTHGHFLMEGRDPVRTVALEEFKKNPEVVHEGHEEVPNELNMFPLYEYKGYSWGMSIDLGSCIGCNACVVACQSENNIPVVGKEQVTRGREMHWIRVDRYFEGKNLDAPEVLYQPVMCQQCEQAPCEVVCPVAATVHDEEGINNMVYNRCVGTRYCSHNCPYKVRRFNFLLFADWDTPSFKLQRNPDVSVRSRGVMEKCNYCQQRINQARLAAKREDRKVRDGDVVTACQATCPTGAIVFGDLNDPNSKVAKLQKEQLAYKLLGELNTRPRTRYLADVHNPSPGLETA